MTSSRRARTGLLAGLAIFALAGGGGVAAQTAGRQARAEHKPAHAAKAQGCPRANYPGDPVCAWEDDGGNLPTPSARAVRKPVADDVRINDDMSVSSADPVAMGKPPVPSTNPYPVRKKEPVGGGAAVNYRF